jgi:hypothetical protein
VPATGASTVPASAPHEPFRYFVTVNAALPADV